jgi:hypothetical protein
MVLYRKFNQLFRTLGVSVFFTLGIAVAPGAQAQGFSAEFLLSSLNGVNGMTPLSGTFDIGSFETTGIGDINADGIDDIAIGFEDSDANGLTNSGIVYVLFGRRGGVPSPFDLDSLDGNNGFVIQPSVAAANFGGSVDAAGDINNDGIDDLIVGASAGDPSGRQQGGISYVILVKVRDLVLC